MHVKFVYWLSVVFFTFILSVIVHEMGHAMTGQALGQKHARVYVWPGYQLYPEFAQRFDGLWHNQLIALTTFSAPKPEKIMVADAFIADLERFFELKNQHLERQILKPSHTEMVLIALMGSGLTWVLSVIALFIASISRTKGGLKYLLLCTSLLFYDFVSYSFLPYYFSLPHLVFIGGTSPEPLNALVQLGCHQTLVLSLIWLVASIQALLIVKVFSD